MFIFMLVYDTSLYISQNVQLIPINSWKVSNLEYFQSSPDEVPMESFCPFSTLFTMSSQFSHRQHIITISEGSCDTGVMMLKIVIIFHNVYFIFDQINAAEVSRRDFFQKYQLMFPTVLQAYIACFI